MAHYYGSLFYYASRFTNTLYYGALHTTMHRYTRLPCRTNNLLIYITGYYYASFYTRLYVTMHRCTDYYSILHINLHIILLFYLFHMKITIIAFGNEIFICTACGLLCLRQALVLRTVRIAMQCVLLFSTRCARQVPT